MILEMDFCWGLTPWGTSPFCLSFVSHFHAFSILLTLQPGCCSKTRTHFVNTLGKPPVVMKDCGANDQHQHANGLETSLWFPEATLLFVETTMTWQQIGHYLAEGGWVPLTHWHCPKALFEDHRLRLRPYSKAKEIPLKMELVGWHPSMSRSTDEKVLFEVASQFPVIWVVRWRHTFEKATGESTL